MHRGAARIFCAPARRTARCARPATCSALEKAALRCPALPKLMRWHTFVKGKAKKRVAGAERQQGGHVDRAWCVGTATGHSRLQPASHQCKPSTTHS
mgnify:CR=1 FL=1